MENKKVAKAYCSSCREEIARGAKKCKTCGSYQDWRRFLSIGNAALPLMAGAIALFVSIASPTKKYLSKIFSEDEALLSVSITQISQYGVSVLVSNNLDETVFFTGTSCTVGLGLDHSSLFTGGPSKWPQASQDTEKFRFYYTSPSDPVVLPPGSQISQQFSQTGISPIPISPKSDLKEIKSYCTLLIKAESGRDYPNAKLLDPEDLIVFDIKEVLKEADYWPEIESRRIELLAKIEQRKSN